MGSTSSQEEKPQEPPEDIAEFRKLGGFRQLDGPTEPFIIPEVPQKRKMTDVKFIVVFGAALVVLLGFLIYTLIHADINKLIHGYDDCGNTCGSTNAKINYIPCSGKDNTDMPFLQLHPSRKQQIRIGHTLYDYIPGECVSKCDSDNVMVMNRCYPEEEAYVKKDITKVLKNIGEDLSRSAGRIVALCFIGFGFCAMMLLMFRYHVAVTVWVILGGTTMACIAATGYFWLRVSLGAGDIAGVRNLAITGALTFGGFSVALIILLVCLFARIKLIIRLFQESMKIIFDMPVILLEPLLTFLASLILGVAFFFLLFWLNTAGNLEPVEPFYEYVLNGTMAFTIWFHIVICLWFGQFIIGCQQMVIAGAVSAHYFTKDKSTLTRPIYNSFYNLIRYHLGSVAFGSLLITLIIIIKALMRSLVKNKSVRFLITCCLSGIENLLKYLSKNAYIQTAMHGQPFYTSGKRAVRLLCANAISAVAVNSVGDFILFMAKVFIIALTVLVGLLMSDDSSHPYWGYGIGIAAIVTGIMAHCCFTVFETAVDTLFLCFCEDQCMNDGLTRPYYMSVDFMQYMEEAKTLSKNKNCLIRN